MKIEIEYTRPMRVIVDGKRYNLTELAEVLGTTQPNLYKRLYNTERNLEEYIEERFWCAENNGGRQCKIYKKGKTWLSAQMVADEADIYLQAAHERLKRWVMGKLTYKKLMRRSDRDWSHATNTSNTPDGLLDGLGPRKSITDLPNAGTWERKNVQSEVFTACGRSHHIGQDSTGTRYRGD